MGRSNSHASAAGQMAAWGQVLDFGRTKAAQTTGPCPAGVETMLPELWPGHRGGGRALHGPRPTKDSGCYSLLLEGLRGVLSSS